MLLTTTGGYAGRDSGYNILMDKSAKIKIAVLRGGPSNEYEVSLKTGSHILSLLRNKPEKFEPLDIFISKDGEWHYGGVVHEPHQALKETDVVWNALHGAYGEDGKVQRILETLGIPFTGSDAITSARAMDKEMSKRLYGRHNLLTPQHELITEDNFTDDNLINIFRTYLHPVIVKPVDGGSSLGVSLAHTFSDLSEAIKHSLEFSKRVMVEEFIKGKEATCGVLDNFRGERVYALMPVEIRKQNHFFNYGDKYSGEIEEICPGNFKLEESQALGELAKKAHDVLGLRHYSRSDFIITPSGKIYILETNSLPGFTEESLMPKSLQAIGCSPDHFVEHVVNLALDR